jgi:putative component of toxin-antitoxin plasmid stabilization module
VSLRIEEYVRADGSVPYRTWFDSLDGQAAAKVATAVVYLAKDGEELIILYGGGTKRRQPADIARAKELHAEYKARKLAASQRRRR